MIDNPMASIIIPVYNGAKFIGHAIESCIAQIEKSIEILVVDDGSTDNTADIVKCYLSDERVKYFYQKNSERSAARNKGILASRGKYLQFLDADDWLDSDKISVQSQWLETNPGYFGVYGPTAFHQDDRDRIKEIFHYTEDNAFSERIWMVNFIPINSLLIRSETRFLFDESMRFLEDWKFIIEILHSEKRIASYEVGKCHVLLHDANSSSQTSSMRDAEMKMLEWIANHLTNNKKHIPQFAMMRWTMAEDKYRGIKMLIKGVGTDLGYQLMVLKLIWKKLSTVFKI